MKRIIAVLPIVLLFIQGCTLSLKDTTKEFVITDRESGKVLDKYEYDISDNRLSRVVTYTDEQETRTVTEFSYDKNGNISRTVVNQKGINGIQTKKIEYTFTEEYDEQNRLIKTITRGDDGTEVETLFGYDETGELRGVAELSRDGSLLMKDYE